MVEVMVGRSGVEAAKEGLEKEHPCQNAGRNQYNHLQMRNQHTQSQVHRHRTCHHCCKYNHLCRVGVATVAAMAGEVLVGFSEVDAVVEGKVAVPMGGD